MAKYEIAFDDKREEVSVYLVRNGSCFTNPPEVIQLEPTPYTEPDMEQVRKEAYDKGYDDATAEISSDEQAIAEKAYRRGYDDAKHECQDCQKIMIDAEQERVDKAYQQGLEDARNRKATCEFCEYTGNDVTDEPCARCYCGYMNMFRPKKEEIQIGDEIKFYNGDKCVVTVVKNGQVLEVMDRDGFSMEMDDGLRNSMDKTGRHFNELDKLLQKMKEDDG